jgi:cell wall-associated NlpC family hydrolase
VGARVSGAMAIDASTRSSSGARVSTISDWIADGDVLLRIGGRDSYHGMSPDVALSGFIGVGAAAWRDAIDSMRVAPSWSHGGGLAVGLGESVELSGEARYRRPLQFDRNGEAAFSPRMEYRAGISLRFGGPSRRGPRRSTVTVGSSGTRGRVASSVPRPSTSIPVSYPGGGLAARVIPTAEEYLGTPYRYGGDTPASGFDCSGFVRYVYAKHGVKLPRTSRDMASSGTRLEPDFNTLRAGDLVMFAEGGAAISHVAVYAGDDRIIHASSSAGRVRYDDLDTERGKWFRRHIVAARRVSPDARGLMADLTTSLLQESVKGLTFDAGDKAVGSR